MQSRTLSQRDLAFLLYEWLDVEALTRRARYADHDRETFDGALDTAAKIAEEHFAPINRLLDTEEPRFDGERVHTPAPLKTALRAFCDAGMMSAGFDFALGGMQLPFTVERACFAWFNAASISAAAYPLLTMGNANLLVAHGTPQQVDTFVRPMLSGRWFGTMCLSEPQAGSSLSDIRTRAVRQPDGSYRIFGNKMWISGAEQDLTENIVHLVLAKVQEPDGSLIPGVKGISLFVVPKVLVDADGTLGERNDVVIAGLNHKMGYRGTTNTLLNFGEGRFTPGGAAGAVGWLVGQERQGLACMFHMMNEARIGVGLGAVMLAYTAYLHALDYARNRPQGRLPKGKDPASPQVPIVQHADVRRMLLAAKSYAEGGLALILYCSRLVDERATVEDAGARERADLLLELLTPVAKSYPSEMGVLSVSQGLQILGGYGYCDEFPLEQYYRDVRIHPIHEGTTGIHGITMLGRNVGMMGGRAYALFLDEVGKAVKAASAHDGLAPLASALSAALDRLTAVTSHLAGVAGEQGPEVFLSDATLYLELFGIVTIAWQWLKQACAAQAASGKNPSEESERFLQGKLCTARYFFEYELPKIEGLCTRLMKADGMCARMSPELFAD